MAGILSLCRYVLHWGCSKLQGYRRGGIHKMGAILCLVGSQAWVADNCPWCLLVWIAYVGYTVAMMVRNENDSIISDFLHTKPMFWIEVAALTSTYLSIFICL